MADKLSAYRRKRDFSATPEPAPERASASHDGLQFVVQKHDASHLHYDFRLELDGRLLSWAVPKGPSLDPSVKRLAMHVEDHPVSYAGFEGRIPPGHYGAGTVIVWDRGRWQPVGDARRGYREGRLKFRLEGEKLHGGWALVRTRGGDRDRGKEPWLLIKERDDAARADGEVTAELPDSVIQHPLRPLKAAAPKAKPRRFPEMLSPQLATLVDEAPATREGWSYEIKLDGYRLLVRLRKGKAALITRGGKDWTDRLPALREELEALDFDDAWIDGEIVVFDAKDRPSFQALQNAFERRASSDAICFICFDLLFADGRDMRHAPLHERRALLRERMQPHLSRRLRFSEDLPGDPVALLKAACEMGLEGLIGKRIDAPYLQGRTRDWIKLKCQQRQEFVVAGFTEPRGSRSGLGALLLAVHDERGTLRYAGRVGTGFDETMLRSLRKRLDALEHKSSALAHDRRARPVGAEVVHWVKPELVAEVNFAERTADGSVRHASFIALREDKPAREIGVETGSSIVSSVKITHPDRVIDKVTGITKLELAQYYERVADAMLPHLKARPIAMVRAPDGVDGEKFFQKHLQHLVIPKARELDPKLDAPHPPLVVIDDATALVGAAQMGVIELHTWNAVATSLERPDRIVFDLDPDPKLPWAQVSEAAELAKTLLDELDLVSFLKTSGGRGLHIVLPLQRRHGWDVCRDFAHAVTQHLARTLPQRFVEKSGERNREGRVFVDYLRNGRGATSACAFSARARPGMGVSVPVAWDELVELRGGDHWTVRTLAQRLAELKGHDPWREYESSRQSLTAAIRALSKIG